MNFRAFPFSILFLIFFFPGCKNSDKSPLPFDFNHPDDVITLPKTLHEISGITFYRKNELACVQDEKGKIFFYDIKKEKLRHTVSFGKDNDYEGIANINDTLYVLCSNGVISQVDALQENVYTNSYKTFLSKENNCEGLCYDVKRKSLLVACKGKPEKGTAPRGTKAIYLFNPVKGELDENPIYLIDPDSVIAHITSSAPPNIFNRLLGENSDKLKNRFEPSDLAIDPFSDDVYVLSAEGKILLVMTYAGNIKFALRLNSEIYKQPEGIIFSSDGDLYISDEGRGGRANLIRLRRKSF